MRITRRGAFSTSYRIHATRCCAVHVTMRGAGASRGAWGRCLSLACGAMILPTTSATNLKWTLLTTSFTLTPEHFRYLGQAADRRWGSRSSCRYRLAPVNHQGFTCKIPHSSNHPQFITSISNLIPSHLHPIASQPPGAIPIESSLQTPAVLPPSCHCPLHLTVDLSRRVEQPITGLTHTPGPFP
jgi:hypothetical protein